MGTSLNIETCECGSQIEFHDYHHPGGENDKDIVIYECNKCHRRNYTIIENFNNIPMTGACVIAHHDAKAKDKETFVKKYIS